MGQFDASVFESCLGTAEGGCVESQYKLGLMYATGHGVGQDNVLAHMWFNIANSLASKRMRKYYIKDKKSAEKEMSSAQIIKAQKMARECVRKKYTGC